MKSRALRYLTFVLVAAAMLPLMFAGCWSRKKEEAKQTVAGDFAKTSTPPLTGEPPKPAEEAKAKTETDLHGHKAPHGGTLIDLEPGHLELVVDASEGKITAYVLDAEAESALRVSDAALDLNISPTGKGQSFTMSLQPGESALTGEKAGDSSQFAAQSDQLKGVKDFTATLNAITIKGQKLQYIPIAWTQ